jgi:hypothetical protein
LLTVVCRSAVSGVHLSALSAELTTPAGSLQQCIFAVDNGWAEYAYDEVISASLDVQHVGAWAESISIAFSAILFAE